ASGIVNTCTSSTSLTRHRLRLTHFGVDYSDRRTNSVRPRPVRILALELGGQGLSRLVCGLALHLQLADPSLQRLKDAPLLFDDRTVAVWTVTRYDQHRSQGTQPAQDVHPRLRACGLTEREKGLVHHHVAGKEHTIRFDERHRVAPRVHGTKREELHSQATEIDRVIALERDIRDAKLHVLQQLRI